MGHKNLGLLSATAAACFVGYVDAYAQGSGQPDYLIGSGGGAIASLFEYNFDEVEQACTDTLGPYGYWGVHVSPPQAHISGPQWWTKYQPTSYDIEDRAGNGEQAFHNMAKTCRDLGVRVIVDAVVNHMRDGYINDLPGSSVTADYSWQIPGDTQNTHNSPATGYSSWDFHNPVCHIQGGDYQNDAWRVRNCELVDLDDLKTESTYVRDNVVKYFNRLLALGAYGFRLDASKHMGKPDVEYWFNNVNSVRTDFFGGGHPYFFSEVIDKSGSEAISEGEYIFNDGNGNYMQVTEFTAGVHLKNEWYSNLPAFQTFNTWSNMMDSFQAVTFVTNHDEERDSGGVTWNYKNGAPYTLTNVFALTYPYGTVKVHSGYHFVNRDDGRPTSSATLANCEFNGGDWTCEHEWRPIRNAVGWRNEVKDTWTISNWWDNGNNCIAFSRSNGSKGGFVAINRGGNACSLNGLQTGLPAGDYCELFGSDVGSCTTFTVDSQGKVSSWNLLHETAVLVHTGATMYPYQGQTIRCVGDYISEVGGTDWDAANSQCVMTYNSGSGFYEKTLSGISPGGWYQFKVTVGGTWTENYGSGGTPGGANIWFNTAGTTTFKWNPVTKVPWV